jgi:hypothetical protein
MKDLRKTGRSYKGPKHVRLHRWLLRSAVYRSLGLAARCLLIELYDLYDGGNNGDVFLSIREAAKRLGIGKNRSHDAFRELEDRGFIRAKKRGVFTTREATTWVLTEFSFGNQPPTKDFMHWQSNDTTTRKQNVVPLTGTIGPRDGNEGHRKPSQKHPNGPSLGDDNPRFRASLVPGVGTQIVYQEGGSKDQRLFSRRKTPRSSIWFSSGS